MLPVEHPECRLLVPKNLDHLTFVRDIDTERFCHSARKIKYLFRRNIIGRSDPVSVWSQSVCAKLWLKVIPNIFQAINHWTIQNIRKAFRFYWSIYSVIWLLMFPLLFEILSDVLFLIFSHLFFFLQIKSNCKSNCVFSAHHFLQWLFDEIFYECY